MSWVIEHESFRKTNTCLQWRESKDARVGLCEARQWEMLWGWQIQSGKVVGFESIAGAENALWERWNQDWSPISRSQSQKPDSPSGGNGWLRLIRQTNKQTRCPQQGADDSKVRHMPCPAAEALEQELVLGCSPTPFCNGNGQRVSICVEFQECGRFWHFIVNFILRLSQDPVADY